MKNLPPVLDPCCGTQMFWFDKNDFTEMCFPDNTFWHVVFDPPHNIPRKIGETGILAFFHGIFPENFRDMLTLGFAECFRVLKPGGTLIFKWSETEIPLSQVLKLTPEKPLYGHRSGKHARTHWVAFMKKPID